MFVVSFLRLFLLFVYLFVVLAFVLSCCYCLLSSSRITSRLLTQQTHWVTAVHSENLVLGFLTICDEYTLIHGKRQVCCKKQSISWIGWSFSCWPIWKTWAHAMISVRPAGRVSPRGEKFNVPIFSELIKVINVKLGMVVILIEFYTFIPLSVTLTIF